MKCTAVGAGGNVAAIAAAAPKNRAMEDRLRQKLPEGIAQEEITNLKDAAKIARFDTEGKPLAPAEKK